MGKKTAKRAPRKKPATKQKGAKRSAPKETARKETPSPKPRTSIDTAASQRTMQDAPTEDEHLRIEALTPSNEFAMVRSITRGNAPPEFWEDTECRDDSLGEESGFELVPLADFPADLPSDVEAPEDPTPLHPELQRCLDRASGPKVRGRIGQEDRHRISEPREYPFSAVCSLEMRRGSQLSVGTGWLVGRNLVLTAGHNLVHNPIVGQPTEVRVYPGRRNRNDTWAGVQEIVGRDRLWVSDPWRKSKDKTRDWAMILLTQPLYKKAGSFGLAPWDKSRILNTSKFIVPGYPSSKASDSPNPSAPFTLWYDIGTVKHVGERTLLYKMDTSQGQSGAPLIAYDSSRTSSGNFICLGIHNWHTGGFNQATRVTPALINQVMPYLK